MAHSKIDKQRLRRDFSNAAATYDAAAIVQHEICDRTLERLDMIKINPKRILDIGTGTGRSLQGLHTRFPNSQITICDIAFSMLTQCQHNYPDQSFYHMACCDAQQLPFADNSFHLIFSTSTFQWCEDMQLLISECRRVLIDEGALIFSTFGPDTLIELRNSWAQFDERKHVHEFLDMHHIGDLLLSNAFFDPVVDMECLKIEYKSLRKLLQDLKDTGSRSKFTSGSGDAHSGLLGKEKYNQLVNAYEEYRQNNDTLPVSYEVIYGYARKLSSQQSHDDNGEIRVPINQLSKKHHNNTH